MRDDEERRVVMRRRRTTAATRRQTAIRRLAALATRGCPDCGGDGIVSVSWNNDPSRTEDVACACVDPALVPRDAEEDPWAK